MNVLVAESSTLLRSRILKLLRPLSGVQQVFEAGSYQQMLGLWRRKQPDIVVVDVFIAGGNALQALCEQVSASKNCHVMVLMNERNDSLAERCRKLGASSVFIKSEEWINAVEMVDALALRKVAIAAA